MKARIAKSLLARRMAGRELSREDRCVLERVLKESAEFRSEAAGQVAVSRLLEHRLRVDGERDFRGEVMARLEGGEVIGDEVEPVVSRRQWMTAAAVVALGLGGGAWWFAATRRGPMAWISGAASAHWPSDGTREVGDGLPVGGRVRLIGGFISIGFRRGVELIVEGAADVEILSENRALVRYGTAAVYVPPEAKGFVLEGPDGQLVGRGAAFAIHAKGSGMEVHALNGEVEAEAPAHGRVVMPADSALWIQDGKTSEIEAMPRKFLTNLPPVRNRGNKLKWLQWRFDEGTGTRAVVTGDGFSLEGADGTLANFGDGETVPRWIDGVSGTALEFSGKLDHVRTGFEGIGGSIPRTVACWVKVPRDLRSTEGYALVGWGAHANPGDTWQLSVNPEPSEGPFGCLRIGTNYGYVIGATDLRDGKWHHVAAVLYPGRNPDVSTNVFLFVDGRLETASAKTVRTVRTDIWHGAAQRVAIGRNTAGMRINEGRNELPQPSFRGAIDEVFLCEAALSQDEIVRLMKGENPASK